MAITAALVKELRERTGAGMMECKKALVEADGNIETAIDNMRKSGQAKAAKKAGRIAAEGVILAKSGDNTGVLVEVNSETDFVARDENFLGFGEKVINAAFANKENDVEKLKATDIGGETVEKTREDLVAKIGENMNVRRVQTIEAGDVVATYTHGARIGVAVALTGGDEDLARDLCMHVAASSPQFVKPEDVDAEVVEKEWSKYHLRFTNLILGAVNTPIWNDYEDIDVDQMLSISQVMETVNFLVKSSSESKFAEIVLQPRKSFLK